MTTPVYLLLFALGAILLVALGLLAVDRIARALFDSPPTPVRRSQADETAPDPTAPGEAWRVDEPCIPVVGSRYIESTQVIKRTPDGSTITVLHLTPEAKRGLTTGGRIIPPRQGRVVSKSHSVQVVSFTPSIPRYALNQHYWLCSCGRRGSCTANLRRARNGGSKHAAMMSKPDPTAPGGTS